MIHAALLALATLAPVDPARCVPEEDPCRKDAASCEIHRAYWNFSCKRYLVAADAFAELYIRDPRPEFLYNHANARRLAGDCWTALALYRGFLELGPTAEQVEMTNDNISRCRAQLGDAREQARRMPAPGTTGRGPVVVDAGRTPRARPAPDTAGVALSVVGGALALVGVGMLGGGELHARRAMASDDETDYRHERRMRGGLFAGGGVTLGLGTALVLGGIVRLIVHARRRGDARARIDLGALTARRSPR